ncbi:LOW QUALITY PROTEIN: peptidyl-prolyl cis-trans isomerase FKBP14 [Diretmus argenteus]
MILFSLCSIFPTIFQCVIGELPEPEVEIEVLHKPIICYRKSKYGDMLLVHYEGFPENNGTMFHSSRHHGDMNPVWFTLGIREALKGWDKGLQNMCTGERRKLTIPPALAYGKEGKGNVKEYLRKEFENHGYQANDMHHEAMVDDIFKNEDEDNDGFISAREFTFKHEEL